jgi:hypothetical protein
MLSAVELPPRSVQAKSSVAPWIVLVALLAAGAAFFFTHYGHPSP